MCKIVFEMIQLNSEFLLFDYVIVKISHDENSAHPISFKKASFKWGEKSSDPMTLKDISLDIQDGSLVRIVFVNIK